MAACRTNLGLQLVRDHEKSSKRICMASFISASMRLGAQSLENMGIAGIPSVTL